MSQDKTSGWLIGVLIELPCEVAPIRHFYAVGHADRAQAEWTAADCAMVIGAVSCSPRHGMEPVEVLGEVSILAAKSLGLKPGETKPLGVKWPRRIMALVTPC